MSILSSLTLSDTAKRAVSADPVTNLRNKMLAALDHQIAAFNADQQNQPYFTYTEKWQLVDEATGRKERVKVQHPIRKMWFSDAGGRILLELRFANKAVQVGGKSSVVVGTLDKLVPTLQTVKKAVAAGELDAVLQGVVESRKKAFKKATPGKPAK